MEASEFRVAFGRLAKQNGYRSVGTYWVRSFPSTIVAVGLQRSGYSPRYYVNLKVWMQGFANASYTVNRTLLRDPGHIFRREPPDYADALDLENDMVPDSRLARLRQLFDDFIGPLTEACSTRQGIWALAREQPNMIYLLPEVRKHLQGAEA